ncbi:MAG: PCRF domain-containing protein, partial [Clostridia bacterium]|nr:PCRF domain-containing protein [Clostridia bacterium]
MLDKLAQLKKKFLELTALIADSEILSDQTKWQKAVKEHSALADTMELYEKYLKCQKDLNECKQLLAEEKDAEFYALAEEELKELKEKSEQLFNELKVALLPKDPKDDSNVVMEIRAGAGGDEAGLFGTVLLRMYMRFAERMRWKTEEIDMNFNDLGGVKEVVFLIRGKGAYSKLKYESGAHRVQRVPTTESQGRIHTSTATVAVLPEVEDVDVEINQSDLKVDTYR